MSDCKIGLAECRYNDKVFKCCDICLKRQFELEIEYDIRRSYEKGRKDAVEEFIKKCKATNEGLICNWDKPYGITFAGMEEKAKEMKEGK